MSWFFVPESPCLEERGCRWVRPDPWWKRLLYKLRIMKRPAVELGFFIARYECSDRASLAPDVLIFHRKPRDVAGLARRGKE